MTISIGKLVADTILSQKLTSVGGSEGQYIDIVPEMSTSEFIQMFTVPNLVNFSCIAVDIDYFVFKTKERSFETSVPLDRNIEILNELYDMGYEVFLIDRRQPFNCSVCYDKLTKKQLDSIGVKYTSIYSGHNAWSWYKYDNKDKKALIIRRDDK